MLLLFISTSRICLRKKACRVRRPVEERQYFFKCIIPDVKYNDTLEFFCRLIIAIQFMNCGCFPKPAIKVLSHIDLYPWHNSMCMTQPSSLHGEYHIVIQIWRSCCFHSRESSASSQKILLPDKVHDPRKST